MHHKKTAVILFTENYRRFLLFVPCLFSQGLAGLYFLLLREVDTSCMHKWVRRLNVRVRLPLLFVCI